MIRVKFSKRLFDDYLKALRGERQMSLKNPSRDELLTIAAAAFYRYVNDAIDPEDPKSVPKEFDEYYSHHLMDKTGMAVLQMMKFYETLNIVGDDMEGFIDGETEFVVESDGDHLQVRQATPADV